VDYKTRHWSILTFLLLLPASLAACHSLCKKPPHPPMIHSLRASSMHPLTGTPCYKLECPDWFVPMRTHFWWMTTPERKIWQPLEIDHVIRSLSSTTHHQFSSQPTIHSPQFRVQLQRRRRKSLDLGLGHLMIIWVPCRWRRHGRCWACRATPLHSR
jgi:hypothetical protein